MKIGVFDSGIGGKSVAIRLQKDYPSDEIMYVDDHENVPYGGRTREDIFTLTDTAIQPLLAQGCEVIVLACNTATAAAITDLRARYPATSFVGLEPMVKPAAEMSKSKIIAICATPYTLSSERYLNLKNKYAQDITILEPDCSQWAYMIEHNNVDDEIITKVIEEVCDRGADVIVLACTHYHWIKTKILAVANGRAAVIDPSEAISRRVGQLINKIKSSKFVG